MNGSVINIASNYLNYGLSIIPIVRGTKKPAVPWKTYQERLPTREEIYQWFRKPYDVALICGKVSGNVEIIDIDNHLGDADKIFWEWKEILNGTAPNLFEKLVIQKTQSGGFHIIYRADTDIPGNTKLASRKVEERFDTFIETRGEGGYALIYPSINYSILQGSFQRLPYLTKEERDIIISVCLSFNQIEKETNLTKSKEYLDEIKKDRPGDVFNEQGDIRPILERHGWRLVHSSGQKEFWQRPGKSGRSWSATFNFIPNKFYVFSSNAYPFEPDRSYDKFSVYALLEHNGDFSRAARALMELGYHGNGQTRLQKRAEKPIIELPEDLPPLTQIGNAMRFCRMYEGRLKYNHTTKEWLFWDGARWRVDTKDNIRLLAKEISRTILDDEARYIAAGYEPKTIRSWYKSSQSLQNIDASLKLAACEPVFATTLSDWDRDLFLVNFINGTLNLHNFDFYTNRPSDYITKVIPIEYDPEAKSELWIESLNMYFNGNQELINFVQKVCGLSLCGAHLEEIIVFLYGTGANGKSIFVNTLRYVFGEYASLLPIEALITQRFDDAKKAEIASLVGARFVVTTEIPLNKQLNEATVKMLTGGDAVKVRNLYQNYFTFEPTFTLWIFGNHKPEIRGADNGIWRRITLIPFEHTIPIEKRLPQSVILERLRAEASGIISWIVEGWKKYCEEGLRRPSIVVAATENYKDDQDPLSGFFNDMIIFEPESQTKGSEIYNAYIQWCETQKEQPVSKKTFFRILEEKGFGFTKDRNKQKHFIGIKLLPNQNDRYFVPGDTTDEYDEPF